MTASHAVAGLSLETPGLLPCPHGYHHELSLKRPTRWLDSGSGLCFCGRYPGAAKRDDFKFEPLRGPVSSDIEAYRAGGVNFPGFEAKRQFLEAIRMPAASGASEVALHNRGHVCDANPDWIVASLSELETAA